MTCGRVLILNRGRIVASDTPDKLRRLLQGGLRVVAEVRAERAAALSALSGLEGVREVEVEQRGGWLRLVLSSAGSEDIRPSLYALCVREDWPLRELRAEEKSLEEIFVSLTAPGEQGEGSS